MSVTSCQAIASRSSSIDRNFTRTYTLTYRVITNDPLDAGYIARTAVPWSIGDTYAFATEFDTGAYCLDISANEDSDDGKQWLVTVQFGPISNDIEEDPFAQAWEYSLDGQSVEVPFDVDVDGKAVCNSIGDPFQTATMRQMNQPILTVTRNEASFQPAYHLYANTVNSDVFYGGAPGTVLCQPVKQHREKSATYGYYWPTTFSMVYNPDGWNVKLINQGFRSRNPRGVLKQILVQGTPITEPCLLTPSGDVMPRGVPPVILEFKPYHKMPFSVLGL